MRIVEFFKYVKNSKGEPYRSSVGKFKMKGTKTKERAVEQAKKLFCEDHEIDSWDEFADDYEVV